MSQVKVSGNASGTGVFEIAAPNANTNYTITLPQATTTLAGTDATQTLTNKTLTTPNIDSAPFATVSGTAPLYGCRAWVRFDGTVAGTFAGGVSTVTRVVGSTTATITTTTAHNLITGNQIYALTGVAAGAYLVTVTGTTTFTITTVATTALTAASITFNFLNLIGAGNINSVTKTGTGTYSLNFSVAMPDTNYACVSSVDPTGGTANIASGPGAFATGYVSISTEQSNGAATDRAINTATVFR